MTIIEQQQQQQQQQTGQPKLATWARELTAPGLEGWEAQGEKNGVKIYTQEGGKLIRGDYLFKTSAFTYDEYASVATSTLIRTMWDATFDKAERRRMISADEGLYWVKYKTPWPITPRDFCLHARVDRLQDDKAVLATMASVKDDQVVPPVQGCVRGTLHVAAWYIRQVPQGIAVTYVNKTDLNGSLPASFMKLVANQIPQCAVQVAEFMGKHGFPPLQHSACVKNEAFDTKKLVYEATVKPEVGTSGAPQDVVWCVAKQMYPKGVVVKTSPPQDGEVHVQTMDNGHHRITLQARRPVVLTIKKK